jgi:hypothetical protein
VPARRARPAIRQLAVAGAPAPQARARGSLTPAASAAARTDQPWSSTRRHIKRPDAGHVFAL